MVSRSMRYSDSQIIELWVWSQPSLLTQDCYRRDVVRFLPELKCEEEKREFEGTLRDLREMLDALTCTKRTSTSKL